ncbi:MAG TPA: Ig-like domain-containing protein [Solirubrobacteraceae bacterium]|nr:Ig-like domain-containing protein [Solirubrobacteraceae bacterium]
MTIVAALMCAAPAGAAARPVISASGATGKEGTRVTVSVKRTKVTTPKTIRFVTRSGSARAKSDFVVKRGILRFRKGRKRATISLRLLNDKRVEGTERFVLVLSRKNRPRFLVKVRITILDRRTTGAPGSLTGPVGGSSGADTTAPAAPANVRATAGDSRVALAWNPNTEADLAGYDVFRSTTLPVSTSGTPLNGSAPFASAAYIDVAAVNATTYDYVVVARDISGNRSAPSAAVSATPQPMVDQAINFQPAAAAIPAGYTPDSGAAYSSVSGQGWVREDSLDGTHVALDISGNTRERNAASDQRLDTFIHMQFPPRDAPSTVVTTPAAWELAVPAGGYRVTLAVGDAGAFFDSRDRINIEGQVAIASFRPSSGDRFFTTTRTVNVADGRLTIDARGGANTKLDYVTVVSDTAAQRPSVTSVSPGDGATGVARDAAVSAEVRLPNVGAGVDPATLSASTVRLLRNRDGAVVPANRNTTGGGDAIILQPTSLLEASTTYRVEITSGVKDVSGAAFLPFDSSFTTGTGSGGGGSIEAAFDQVALDNAQGQSFTTVTMGPDEKLYAATMDGNIFRFDVRSDGTLAAPQVISSVQSAAGGPRTILGLAFDPAATADNLILWISNDEFAFDNATDWSGKITRLSGADLQNVQDYVVGLPRSVRDHQTNSVAFGPDRALYVTQGSNSATGAPDNAWGMREEHVLNAAVLRVNIAAITAPPLNVQSEAGGSYNPFAGGAPVTVYASGVRNAFDLVWHSNGSLYVPTNASAAGGSTPATPTSLPSSCTRRLDAATNGAYTDPPVPALVALPSAQHDRLNRIVKGGYYGHPNPNRCEWVLNGGNPTDGVDANEIPEYPVGTLPDRNLRSSFDLGAHFSPDGALEYRSGNFGGELRGKLLVTRYSAGDDVIVLTPGASDPDIQTQQTGLTGLTGFVDPLDITEDRRNGNLYITELGASRITLLRPR